MKRIVICYADTGGGHKQAADAIREAILEVHASSGSSSNIEVITQGALQSKNVLNSAFLDFYNYLLRHHPARMKHYYRFIEWLKPNESKLAYKMCGDFARNMWMALRPAVVVSVHPMLNHYTHLGLIDAGLRDETRFVIVVTDPNAGLWSGWACKAADLIIAPNDLAAIRLRDLGVNPNTIRTIGMPVKPSFLRPPLIDRDQLLRELGLGPNRITILLSGGWAGGGAVLQIYRALQEVRRPIQVVVLCGHNSDLLDQLHAATVGSALPTAVLPFVDSLADLMSACDLLITKGGGLTTAEAVARRIPMVLDMLSEPMPQEAGTVNLLIEAGLAQPMKSIADIARIVQSFQPAPDRLDKPLPAVHNLDRSDAVFDIAREILGIAETVKNLSAASS